MTTKSRKRKKGPGLWSTRLKLMKGSINPITLKTSHN